MNKQLETTQQQAQIIYTREQLESLLQPWQITFVETYCYDNNKTRAYREAKRTHGKLLTDDACYKGANVLLQKPEIKQYIEIIKQDVAGQVGISKIMMINELRKIATSNIAHLHDTWITRKDFQELDDDQRAAIQEISTKVINTIDHAEQPIQVEYVKIKMYDKRLAISEILKAMGWTNQDMININVQQEEKRVGRVEVITATPEQQGIK